MRSECASSIARCSGRLGPMRFHSYAPRPPLCNFVEEIRLYENYTGAHRRERILPSGTFAMIFNLRDDELRIYRSSEPSPLRRFSGALISGAYAEPFMTDMAEEACTLGVHFKPGGAFPFFSLPAGELANAHIDLGAIWGSAAAELHGQLHDLPTPSERFLRVEQALMRRLVDPPTRHDAVRAGLDLLARPHDRVLVRDIAKAVDLSERRFIEVFTEEVGLTPKLFARVQRFQRAMAASRDAVKPDWASLAVACGYFDQAHLIRDFVAFSGVSPADYHRRQKRIDHAGVLVKHNHLPLPG